MHKGTDASDVATAVARPESRDRRTRHEREKVCPNPGEAVSEATRHLVVEQT